MKLQIEKMVYGGAGLAHEPEEGAGARKALSVPFTLPGEVVEAELGAAGIAGAGGDQNGYRDASLLQVLTASTDRVVARCVHFGQCGGCQYQHADYPAQWEMKVGILRETLERAGLTALPEVQVHAGEAWGYRNRIRLRVAEVEGALRVGYNQRGGDKFLPLRECLIAAPVLWRAAMALLQLAANDAAAERWLRTLVEVELFATADEARLQMTVFVRGELKAGFAEFCEALRGLVPELAGAGVAVLAAERPQQGRRAERPKARGRWGADGLQYVAAGRSYWVSRGGFFQVNRFLVDELVRVVTSGREGALAWDLYAGVGLFSRALLAGGAKVVAVEGGEQAAADLAGGMKGMDGVAVCAATVEFLRRAVVQRERPDLVLMDPPRAGLGAEVCALLARVNAAQMVYVSCDPVTLGRDLKRLVDSGYRLVEVHMVDLFPQTFHLETVVILRR